MSDVDGGVVDEKGVAEECRTAAAEVSDHTFEARAEVDLAGQVELFADVVGQESGGKEGVGPKGESGGFANPWERGVF